MANVSSGDQGAYTLVVTNALGAVTSSPPASLTVALTSGKAYEAAVRAANPVAYWRLNETGDPSTNNTAAFDYWGGLAGIYRTAAQNGFNGIEGPRPADFPEFESNNYALETMAFIDQAWVTVPALNLNTNTVTITAWINPNISHNDYQAVFYTRKGSTAGIQFTIDNQIGYTWNDGDPQTWEFYSELRPPLNQWSFVALVVDPTNATLYLYNAAFTNPPPSVTLNLERVGADLRLTWPQGTLLEAPGVNGPYATNNAVSPFTFAPTGAAKFFRVKVR